MIITTFVFMDLEATGLPEEECNQTKITEASFYAFSKEQLLECDPNELPRTTKKLNLCFNPDRQMRPVARQMSGEVTIKQLWKFS